MSGLRAARSHVGWVASVAADADGGVRFTLRDGTECLVDGDSAWRDLWARTVDASAQYAWPVYVVREPDGGRVRLMLPATVHEVESVRPDTVGGRGLRVGLAGANAVRALPGGLEGYERMASRLREALASGRRVVLTEDPLGRGIIDVRFAPADAPVGP